MPEYAERRRQIREFLDERGIGPLLTAVAGVLQDKERELRSKDGSIHNREAADLNMAGFRIRTLASLYQSGNGAVSQGTTIAGPNQPALPLVNTPIRAGVVDRPDELRSVEPILTLRELEERSADDEYHRSLQER
jgi:hypothetical protein